MKTCFKCGLPQSLDNFYAHPQMADGHLGKCKECCKRYARTQPGRPEYDKARNRLPHRVAARAQYQANHPEICNPLKKAWERRNPEKKHASVTLNNAVRDGKIVRQTVCEVCVGSQNVEAHHDDYSKPFEVRWLCKKHHWAADCVRREQEAVSFNFGYNVA